METSDGRTLRANVAGPEDGPLLVFHTGTPGTNRLYAQLLDEGARRGLRQVCCARPGYGGSARLPGRSIADCAADAVAVADALGAESFYVVGHSGGAPHALACAAALADRVIAAAAVSGFGPRRVLGDGWMTGMAEGNVEEFGAALAGEATLAAYLEPVRDEWREIRSLEQLRTALWEFFSDADRELLLDDSFLRYQLGCVQQIGGEEIWGWFDDDHALVGEWGFAVEGIEIPVAIWHGEEDPAVPAWQSGWIAERIASARFHCLRGEGHISPLYRHYGAILDELLELGRRGFG